MVFPDLPAGLHPDYPEALPPPSDPAKRAEYLRLLKGPRRAYRPRADALAVSERAERAKRSRSRNADYRAMRRARLARQPWPVRQP